MLTPKQWFTRTLLAILFLAALLRITGFAVRFSLESLQMDFSAFYTAGESLNHGLSPYTNYLNHDPRIWDGINILQHSRFHYPPLVGNFFQLFALLPYAVAKGLWTLIEIACLGASLYITFKILRQPLGLESLLSLGILVCLYYPLLILLERGQVDTITLLLLLLGIQWIIARRNTFWAGVLFALAALVKLHCIYILPFLILRKQWKALGGLTAAGIGLILLSTVLNGPVSSLDYVQKQIPAISNYGNILPGETDPFKQTAVELLKDLPRGYTLMDGRRYISTDISFYDNATLVRTRLSSLLQSITRKLSGLELNVSTSSLIFFGAAFGLFVLWERFSQHASLEADPGTEFIFWQIPLAIILLCAPLTWPMNCIWLLPTAFVLARELSLPSSLESPAKTTGWMLSVCAGILGLILAALPDSLGFRFLVPYGERLVRYKYVLGEILVLGGLLGIRRSRTTSPR